jgi:DMSO/TMAO reductase YedYZ molybdopterin-dependent catalytic subunit
MNGRTDEAEDNAIELDFESLVKLGGEEVTTLLSCGGNKRKQVQLAYKEIKGLPWRNGAIGNAKYKGCSVRKVLLEYMDLKEEDLKGKHLIAVGSDPDFQGKHFEVSIPMEYALDSSREVMLAYEMNGEDIPKVHGFPIRLVCPGMIAVRSCKWVMQLIISDTEANHAV